MNSTRWKLRQATASSFISVESWINWRKAEEKHYVLAGNSFISYLSLCCYFNQIGRKGKRKRGGGAKTHENKNNNKQTKQVSFLDVLNINKSGCLTGLSALLQEACQFVFLLLLFLYLISLKSPDILGQLKNFSVWDEVWYCRFITHFDDFLAVPLFIFVYWRYEAMFNPGDPSTTTKKTKPKLKSGWFNPPPPKNAFK